MRRQETELENKMPSIEYRCQTDRVTILRNPTTLTLTMPVPQIRPSG